MCRHQLEEGGEDLLLLLSISNNLISTPIMVSMNTQQGLIPKQNEGGLFAAQQTLPQSQQYRVKIV